MMVKGARYSWPDAGADFALHTARYQFLHLLDEECPEAREKLSGAVRTAYRSMFDVLEAHAEGAPVSKKAPNWDDVYRSDAFVHWLDQSGPEIEDAVDPFLSALKSWIEEYNLRAPWLGDAAIRTIRALESDLDWKRRPSWVIRSPDIPHGLTISELKFQFSHQFGFGPVLRTRDDMEKEAWREFTKAFNAWFQNLDETLKQRGYEKNRRRDKPERDTRWLVRFQCVDKEYAEIAKSEKKSEEKLEKVSNKISKAVEKRAKYLSIKLREARPGRRPKKKLT